MVLIGLFIAMENYIYQVKAILMILNNHIIILHMILHGIFIEKI